jgi:hypothetical protein
MVDSFFDPTLENWMMRQNRIVCDEYDVVINVSRNTAHDCDCATSGR